MKGCRFSRVKPTAILNFLITFKQVLDSDLIPEDAALEVKGNFTDNDASTLYCLMMNENGAEIRGFQTWAHEMLFLIQMYAKNRALKGT